MSHAPYRFWIKDAEAAACAFFQIEPHEIKSRSSARRVARPRQVAMYLARKNVPGASLPKIGAYFGGRDHTTVIAAIARIEKLKESNLNVALAVAGVGELMEKAAAFREEQDLTMARSPLATGGGADATRN